MLEKLLRIVGDDEQGYPCQGVTPSNSKGGLPAPEAGACARKREQWRYQASSVTHQRGLQDKAESRGKSQTRRPAFKKEAERWGQPLVIDKYK